MSRRKITVFGAGNVGCQAAMITAYKQLGNVVLWNRTESVAKGVALDIMESSPVDNFDTDVLGTASYEDTADSDIIAITAGSPRKEGQSRDDLLFVNADIVKSITENAAKYSPNATIIVLTNPLDAMVWLAYKVSGFDKHRVVGMAGILDTARFRKFVSMEAHVSVKDVSAVVLGGHGDFMLPLPDHSSVNGIPLRQMLIDSKIAQIIDRTRKAGEEIIKYEGTSAFFSPAYSLVEMMDAILKDRKRVLPCAAHLSGEYGLRNIFMGVPVKLGSRGVEQVIELKLTENERKEFVKSAVSIQELLGKLKAKYNLRD